MEFSFGSLTGLERARRLGHSPDEGIENTSHKLPRDEAKAGAGNGICESERPGFRIQRR